MDLSAERLHSQLDQIADQGWDGPVGVALLRDLRVHVVRPVVRGSHLRGPAADQAEASAWEAAWEAIRRPSARVAANPGGMVWSAVRRSVVAEIRHAQQAGIPGIDPEELERAASADRALGVSRRPEGPVESEMTSPCLSLLLELLISVGWDQATVHEVVCRLADSGARRAWRTIAGEVGVPAWQVRRVGSLLVAPAPSASLLALVSVHGRPAVEHPAARWAARSTVLRWQPGPEPALEQLSEALKRSTSEQNGSWDSSATRDPLAWTPSESAEMMGGLP